MVTRMIYAKVLRNVYVWHSKFKRGGYSVPMVLDFLQVVVEKGVVP